LTDLSSVLSQCTRLTDRRTDRIHIARPRLHSMQRGKNYNALQLEAASHSGLFWPNLYCECTQSAISQLPIKILTSSLDSATPFPKKSNNLAIRRRLHAVTLTFKLDFESCWCIGCHVIKLCTKSVQNRKSTVDLLTHSLIFAVDTSRCDLDV